MIQPNPGTAPAQPLRAPFEIPFEPLVRVPPVPSCAGCVVIPVRNEAHNIGATLRALVNQRDHLGQPLDPSRYEVIVLANNCCDDTTAIVRQFAAQHPHFALHLVERTLPLAEAHVGRARRLLMDEAYRRLLLLGRRRGMIATTDGDTIVAPDWIAANLREIDTGADAVGGRILTSAMGRLSLDKGVQRYYVRDAIYQHLRTHYESLLDPDPFDPWPRHYHHTGASLALTAETYAYVGGLPPLRTAEDVALYHALLRYDARFRHSPAVRVITSARRIGRASGGMADQLSHWGKMAQTQQTWRVEAAETIATQARGRRQLRSLWQKTRLGHRPSVANVARLAETLKIELPWLWYKLLSPLPFGALYEQIEQHRHERGSLAPPALVDVTEAIYELRMRLARD